MTVFNTDRREDRSIILRVGLQGDSGAYSIDARSCAVVRSRAENRT